MVLKSVEYKYGSVNVLLKGGCLFAYGSFHDYPDTARPYQITVSPLSDLGLPSRTEQTDYCTYKGWQISKMEEGHWNCSPVGKHFPFDSHDTLKECRLMIDRKTDNKGA